MRALTFQGIRTIRHETVPDPAILAPGDAIVQVRLAAICGSDLHVYHGRETGIDAGTVMGHELVGQVVETGAAVANVRVGDLVMCPFTTSCGTCFYCASGLTARCVHGQLFGWVSAGAGLQGGQAELVRVPLADSTLVAVPDDIRPEEALLLGDVLATGYHCARMAEVGPRGTFVVVGCGPVGLMAVAAARALGAEQLYAVDPVPARLEWAARFGAEPLRLDAHAPVVAAIHEATGGRGADAVLEAVGRPSAGRLAYDLVRPGGTIAVVGVHHAAGFAFSPGEAYDKNLTYRVGRCPARHYMPALVDLVRQRRDLASVFTHRRKLAEGAEAYALFDEKGDGCVKVLLEP